MIQTLLQQLGYDPGPIDGKIGQKTTTAIEVFQTKAGLAVDGKASADLVGSLQRELANEIRQHAANGDVSLEDVQFLLQQAGYDPGPVDGKMGTKTTEAITAFQTAMNLPFDGEPSVELLQALHKEFAKLVGPTAILSAVDGNVRVNNQQTETGAVLSAEDKITTQAGTTAELTLSDGSRLALEENSRLTLAELTHTAAGARISYLKLQKGRVRAFLSQEHQHEGSAFTIETPNARIDATFSEPDIEVSYSAEKAETVGLAHTVTLMAKNLTTDETKVVPVGSTVIIASMTIKVLTGGTEAIAEVNDSKIPKEGLIAQEKDSVEIIATEAIGVASASEVVPTAGTAATSIGTGKLVAIGAGALAGIGGIVAIASGSGGGEDSNPTSPSPSGESAPNPTPTDNGECADQAGSYRGTYSALYCDGLNYTGIWTAEATSDCSFTTYNDWGKWFEGTIAGNALTGSGTDNECGTINFSGTLLGNEVNGTFSYSLGGGGSVSGSKQ
ncbi:MAG: hypothetical protein GY801_04210 [bacterium]|nr:hypothetical protein [bacterium]